MKGVYVKFPKSGLGNLLLIWARARVFAHINDLPFATSRWWGIRWGAWLRIEQKKRVYWGYFKEDSFWGHYRKKWQVALAQKIKEPEIRPLTAAELIKPQLYYFYDQEVTDRVSFRPLKEYRDFLKAELYRIIQPKLLKQLEQYPVPEIAVHIRRGDFKITNLVTPLSFFIDCILTIREITGTEMPVTVFSDAENSEILPVLSLANVKRAEEKPDILDILLMSKSKFIVLSESSTFSYWGAFLSDAVLLKPFNDWHEDLRSEDINNLTPEIRWIEGDINCKELLKRAWN
jgi:hypothetical protein